MIARRILALLVALVTIVSIAKGQMITGKKHIIFVETPKNWLYVQNDQLPYFIKPNEKNVSDKTYLYVYGLDYESSPDINGWLKGDNDDMLSKHPGLKIDSLPIILTNIKKTDYLTGRYKTITYEYPDLHKEAMLVIECKNTIVTVVLSASNSNEFDKYLPSFKKLAQTVKILKANVKIEK